MLAKVYEGPSLLTGMIGFLANSTKVFRIVRFIACQTYLPAIIFAGLTFEQSALVVPCLNLITRNFLSSLRFDKHCFQKRAKILC